MSVAKKEISVTVTIGAAMRRWRHVLRLMVSLRPVSKRRLAAGLLNPSKIVAAERGDALAVGFGFRSQRGLAHESHVAVKALFDRRCILLASLNGLGGINGFRA
jgi:hypothetical protein